MNPSQYSQAEHGRGGRRLRKDDSCESLWPSTGYEICLLTARCYGQLSCQAATTCYILAATSCKGDEGGGGLESMG